MRARVTVAVALLAALGGGCGGKGVCSYQILERIDVPGVLQCCGASYSGVVTVRHDDADVDLAFAKADGPPPPAHAWLTTAGCAGLFAGDYPPAAGSPSPGCTVFIGPVAPGEVSPRRKLPRGDYRVWVQAFSSSPTLLTPIVDVGVWGTRCGVTGP